MSQLNLNLFTDLSVIFSSRERETFDAQELNEDVQPGGAADQSYIILAADNTD